MLDTRTSSINHSDLSIVFAAPEHIPFLLTLSPKLPTLKYIVSIEPTDDDQKRVLTAWGKTRGIKVMDITECTYVPPIHFQTPLALRRNTV